MDDKSVLELCNYTKKFTEAEVAKLDEIKKLGKLLMEYADRLEEEASNRCIL